MRALAASAIVFVWAALPASALEPAGADYPDRYTRAIESVVDALNEGSNQKYIDIIDFDALFESVFEGIDVDARSRRDFMKGALSQKHRFGADIIELMPEDGYAAVVRTKPHPEGAQVLIRVDSGENGFGYQDFIVRKSADGRMRVVDWYSYASGENASDTMRQMYVLTSNNTGNIDRLLKIVTGKDLGEEQLLDLLRASIDNDAEEFFGIYDQIDEELRSNRVLLLTALKVSIYAAEDARYEQVLQDMARFHSDDENLQFIFLDHYFLNGEYDKALVALDNVANHMGVKDNALMTLKASILMTAGKAKQALRLSEQVRASEPALELNYWTLLSLYGMTKSYSQAVTTLDVLSDRFNYLIDKEALLNDPALHGFVESDEFKGWLTRRQ